MNTLPKAESLPAASGKLDIGMLIWAIVNTILMSLLGVPAIVFTTLASKEVFLADEKKKLRIALIINIAVSALFVAIVTYLIILICKMTPAQYKLFIELMKINL